MALSELVNLIEKLLQDAKFTLPDAAEPWDVATYRQQYKQISTNPPVVRRFSPEPVTYITAPIEIVHHDMFESYIKQLAVEFSLYIDEDICLSFNNLSGQRIKLRQFAEGLLRYSAVTDPTQAINILESWLDSDSVCYTQMYLLQGIEQEKEETLHIDPYTLLQHGNPLYLRNQLPHFLSNMFNDLASISSNEWLKKSMVLCHDIVISPFINKPPFSNELIRDNNHIWVDTLIKAMSIACNGAIYRPYSWFFVEDSVKFLTLTNTEGWESTYCPGFEWPMRAGTVFTQEHANHAFALYSNLIVTNDDNLLIGIQRWIESKSRRTLVDQSIDVRIILEILLGSENYRGPMAKRISTRGAWYLKNNDEDRLPLCGEFRNIYSKSSSVVHTGRIRDSDYEEYQKLIPRAQNLCREIILERIDRGKPEWGRISPE